MLDPQRNTPEWAHYEKAYQSDNLLLQACHDCDHTWHPARSECPRCLSGDWEWSPAAGNATLVSWVVYHRSPMPDFPAPYNVIVAKLAEGPQLLSVLSGDPLCENAELDAPLELEFIHLHGKKVPAFRYGKRV